MSVAILREDDNLVATFLRLGVYSFGLVVSNVIILWKGILHQPHRNKLLAIVRIVSMDTTYREGIAMNTVGDWVE